LNRSHLDRIDSLQLVRAIAALMVVIGHALSEGAALAKLSGDASGRMPWPGGSGVDLFFVISGFVMVYASERLFGAPGAPRQFLLRRIARIVPLYWICSTAYLAVLAVGVKVSGGLFPSPLEVLASYAFIPFDTFGQNNGFAFPFFNLGWTLNYEFFFYGVFALFISLSRTRTVLATTGMLIVLVVLGLILKPSSPTLRFWTQPIMLEFVAGMWLAVLRRRDMALPPVLGWILGGLAVVWLILDPGRLAADGGITPNDFRRLLNWGLPAVAVIAVMTLGRATPAGAKPLLRIGEPLGDASYALYLTHPFVMIVCAKLFEKTMAIRIVGAPGFAVLVAIIAIAVSLAVHRWLEKPATRLLGQWLGLKASTAARLSEPPKVRAV
jgi:peptidoglycan/LPS O-acetylase OafA/YrhL